MSEFEDCRARGGKVREAAVSAEDSVTHVQSVASSRVEEAISQMATSNKMLVERIEALTEQPSASTDMPTKHTETLDRKLDEAITAKTFNHM